MAQTTKTNNKEYIFAVGRRKAAVARVRLYPKVKNGEILVNGKPIEECFSGAVAKTRYEEPFRSTNTLGKYAVTVKVEGGGKNGQLEAVVMGIARALSVFNKEFRPLLKKKQLLTRDSRVRERRKIGTGGKARRKKQSPKR